MCLYITQQCEFQRYWLAVYPIGVPVVVVRLAYRCAPAYNVLPLSQTANLLKEGARHQQHLAWVVDSDDFFVRPLMSVFCRHC